MSKNANSANIYLNNVRLSFPKIWKAEAFEEGQSARFEAAFLLDPSDKAHKKSIEILIDVARATIDEQWNGIPDDVELSFQYADASPVEISNNLTYRGKKKKYDGYEGMFCVSSATRTRPAIVDRDRTTLAEEDGRPYGGCYVNAVISLWCNEHPKGGKRCNVELRAIQFVKDGEAFGRAAVSPDAVFEVLDDDEDDGFLN